MSLELLEKKLRTLPEDSFDEVDEETKAALREVEEMKADSSKGKSYTDVDAMMRELLA